MTDDLLTNARRIAEECESFGDWPEVILALCEEIERLTLGEAGLYQQITAAAIDRDRWRSMAEGLAAVVRRFPTVRAPESELLDWGWEVTELLAAFDALRAGVTDDE